MAGALPPTILELLLRAEPSGVTAVDDGQSRDLCTLARLGLVSREALGPYVLTDAGRRYLAIEMPSRAPSMSD